GKFGSARLDRRREAEAVGDDHGGTAAQQAAQPDLALGRARDLDLAVGDTGLVAEPVGAAHRRLVERFVELAADVVDDRRDDVLPAVLAGARAGRRDAEAQEQRETGAQRAGGHHGAYGLTTSVPAMISALAASTLRSISSLTSARLLA